MKKLTSILSWTGVAAIVIALSSCGSMNNNFTRAKYYNFGHNDPVITLNKPIETKGVETAAKTATKVESTVKNKVTENKHATNNIAGSVKDKAASEALVQKRIRSNKLHSVAVGSIFSRVIENTKKNMSTVTAISPDEITNTETGGRGGTVPLIILIILSILIPPLAVFLHDNLIKGHFWWVLILSILGAGFYFGFSLIPFLGGLLWLAAVIWAILICLGTAGSV